MLANDSSFNHFQSSVGSKIVMALNGLGLVTMLVFTCWERSWGRSREYLRAGVVELVFGWPESLHAESA